MMILDLFCGAGGASMGYHKAFPDAEIVGVDNVPQPNYPFEFIQMDVMDPDFDFDFDIFSFDLIHASPPCQAYSTLSYAPGAKTYPTMVEATRALMEANDVPWVIENVPGAPLREPFQLCGTSFGLTTGALGITWELRRHRIFETSFDVWAPPVCSHRYKAIGVYGDLSNAPRPNNPNRRRPFNDDGTPANDWKAGFMMAGDVMGIDWMTPGELVEAIPPAYTEWIGNQLTGLLR